MTKVQHRPLGGRKSAAHDDQQHVVEDVRLRGSRLRAEERLLCLNHLVREARKQVAAVGHVFLFVASMRRI
jgi:hypothetical protein